MSDLETAASRTQTAPVSALAGGKLQAISAAGVRFGDTDQLVDAFAEVFARMAVAAPPPVQSEPADTHVGPEDDGDSEASLESSGQESENKDSEQPVISSTNQALPQDEQPELADQTVSDAKTEADAESQADEIVVNEPVQRAVEAVEENEVGLAEQPDQLDAPIVEPEISTLETDTVKKVEATVAAAAGVESDTSRKRGSQGTQNIDAPDDQATVVQTKTSSDSGESGRAVETNHETDLSSEQAPQSQGDSEPKRTKRQQRLNENRENQRLQEGSQGSQRRTETQPGPAVTGDSAAALSAPATKPPAVQPPPPAASNVNAAVSAIQNATVRTSATSTASATSDSRGTSNSIQPLESNRVDAGQRRETSGAKQNATDTTARIKLVQRVSRAFQHLGPDGGMVRLRLAPAELGSVRVEMRVDKQTVKARVVTETEAASATLREHLPDLRARLESFGMQVEQIEVDTEANTEQHGLPFDREPQQRNNQRQPGNRNQLDQGSQDQLAEESSRIDVAGPIVRPSLAKQGIDLKL